MTPPSHTLGRFPIAKRLYPSCFQVMWAEQQVVKRRTKRDYVAPQVDKLSSADVDIMFNDPLWPKQWPLVRHFQWLPHATKSGRLFYSMTRERCESCRSWTCTSLELGRRALLERALWLRFLMTVCR